MLLVFAIPSLVLLLQFSVTDADQTESVPSCTYCRNDATCWQSIDGTTFYCECPYGFTGADCSLALLACFPGDATVKLQDGSTKTMDRLDIGDTVQAWDSSTGDVLWSKVELFLDPNPNIMMDFVEIETESGQKMALTARHLLPVRDGADLQWKWAESVVVGDEVRSSERWVRVSKVDSRVSQGAYAPLTSAGTVVVSGVATSCFAVVTSHDVAYWATKPAVWFAQWFGENAQQGIHWYSRLLLDYAGPVASGLMTR